MNARAPLQPVSVSSPGEDEHALLIRLELLLENESELLAARDADGLAVLADERARLATRIADAARVRQAGPRDAEADARFLALYQRLRQRHDVQAQIIRRHAERNERAVGVLSQATGQTNLYQADGRVAMKFVAV